MRLPRRLYQHPKWKTRSRHPQESPSVEPRAFQVDHLPSTAQLNAIMDKTMSKVKSMVKELEDEKGNADGIPDQPDFSDPGNYDDDALCLSLCRPFVAAVPLPDDLAKTN